jgi:3-keto-disaccharide hydrolase
MARLCLAGALALALVATALLPGSSGQEKKQPAKKKERIAVADPKDAAKDPDFAIQGEYEGEVVIGEKTSKAGIQMIARGGGKFIGKAYVGGLPGAGWADNIVHEGTGERTGEGKATIKDDSGGVVGELAAGVITLSGNVSGRLKKVERKSKTLGAKPPEGAVVLFAKEGNEANWTNGKIVELSDGRFLNVGIKSKEKFGAFKAHIEFRTPWMPNSTGQGRGNSGVYLQDRYECQVLDSFGLSGENNECGGIYTQHKPKVNMCLPPLVWQTYDIEFTPAVFEGEKKVKNARATIHHNGVLIHDNVELPKECPGGQKEAATPGPFQFQDHGDPVVYRNVWVVPVK